MAILNNRRHHQPLRQQHNISPQAKKSWLPAEKGKQATAKPGGKRKRIEGQKGSPPNL